MDNSPVGRLVNGLAKYVALAGGAILIVVVVVTVVSIVGRALIPLGLSPILGDYEIVEAGMAFAIFAFLPWCHLTRGHAIVAILTDRLPARYNAVTELLVDIVIFLVASFIAWRHAVGLVDKFIYVETTFILRLPLWWWYAAGLIGAVTFVIVAAYCVVRSARNAFSSTPVMPRAEVAE
jgi:TRAP-type C4-dicarboxylate transport system permease small subunit